MVGINARVEDRRVLLLFDFFLVHHSVSRAKSLVLLIAYKSIQLTSPHSVEAMIATMEVITTQDSALGSWTLASRACDLPPIP